MEMKQVSESCFAVLNEKNRVCDANSGLINRGGGVVIDTQSDLGHARQMIDMFGKVWTARPKRVVNTHEDADHVWGNQLFEDAEIIAHRSVPERMKIINDHAVAFSALQRYAAAPVPSLADSRSYLAHLPDSERAARDLCAWGEQHLGELGSGDAFPLTAVRLLEPVEVAALFDFGLTPRHLENSAETLMKYEKDNPQTAPLLQAFARP